MQQAEINIAVVRELTQNPQTLPEIQWADTSSLQDNRTILLVTSPTAASKFSSHAFNFPHGLKINIHNSTTEYVNRLVEHKPDADVVYAVGGGTVADIGRLLAYEWNLDSVVIPTVLSTDAPFVNSTGVRENGCVRYVPSKIADLVLLDPVLLRLAPRQLTAGGCCDVLSIYTALYDWRLASDHGSALPDELYEPRIAAQAESILEYLMSQKIAISKTSDSGLETLAQALAAEVELCNVYGNSRPEEGSEHFFAYALEPELPRATHAELVGIGILISAYIQKQNVNLMKDFMDSVGMNYLPVGITPTIISSVLDNMQEYVITHGLRYSIWNEYSRQADDVHRITDLIGL